MTVSGDPSSITVTVGAGSSLGETCGLCGTRSGDLRRSDGSIADITDRAQVEAFTMDYLTPADQQALRPIRRECSECITYRKRNKSQSSIPTSSGLWYSCSSVAVVAVGSDYLVCCGCEV